MTTSAGPPVTRLLVVDDSEGCRRLAARLLVAAGYEVDVAVDGRAAVEATRAARYGLVLMDVRMPGMDGARASRAIHAASEDRPKVPIVATTTMSREELESRYPAAGFEDYVHKPLRAETLLPVVERWLDGAVPSALPSAPPLDRHVLDRIQDDLGPEGFAEVLDVFADEILSQLDQIPGALRDGALDVVEMCAHRVRGSAATVGASNLEEHAASLEEAARGSDTARTLALSESIVACAQQVRDEVARVLASV